jgi:GNAT superfamily N-acetyltransferase
MLDFVSPLRTRPFAIADARAVEPWLDAPGLSRPAGSLRHEWPHRLLADSRIVALVGEADGRRIGFVRLDCGPDRVGEVTLVIAPEGRRRGHGSALFLAALKEARRLGLHALVACIDLQNAPALSFFQEQGFVRDHLVGDRLVLRRLVHAGEQQPPLWIDG